MDLGYLREHPEHLPAFLHHQRIRETPVPGGSVGQVSRLTLDDGASVLAKAVPADRAGLLAAEVAGLAWLREAGGAPVPEVIAALPELLVLEWIDTADPTPAAAVRFGRELAATHRAGAASFGAAWEGYIGRLPQDNTPTSGAWAQWFAEHRLLPYLKRPSPPIEAVIARLGELVPDEPPARLHGDLWPGNLLWQADRVWLIDPAAHGGHRETDLAQLHLFGGAPLVDLVIGGYEEIWPLEPNFPARVPIHQLHLLLVHDVLFGGTYFAQAEQAARQALRVRPQAG